MRIVNLPPQHTIASVLSRFIAIFFLLFATQKLPYSYFTMLRLIVCAVSIYHCFLSVRLHNGLFAVVFGLVVLIYNPAIPIFLKRATWEPIDVVTAISFFISIMALRQKRTNSQNE